ncbi:hypothetical protein [Clostridium sp. HBUAS56010]|uniref:hypothetical protein n=1 Tax=Clostridium sp. HBUAS56010 TaxID=2571127 RepID=UPI001177DEA3|nr:hypothetical protein [Clostridium sp. HBUAS56010]
MENEVTVGYLHKLTGRLIDNGRENMILACEDVVIHEDEISMHYSENKLELRGHLFNSPIVERVNKFIETVNKAKEELYFKD